MPLTGLLARGVGGGMTPHMKGVGMLVGNFELNLIKRRPIWAWPKRFLTPKRDDKNIHIKNIFLYFSPATLNETTAKYDGVLPRTP